MPDSDDRSGNDGANVQPPKPETAETHTGSDDVSHGMNSNLDPSLTTDSAGEAAAQDIREQHRNTDEDLDTEGADTED